MSRVHKTNFLASWEEIGDDYEMQDTYALTQMNSLEGKGAFCFDASLLSSRSRDPEETYFTGLSLRAGGPGISRG